MYRFDFCRTGAGTVRLILSDYVVPFRPHRSAFVLVVPRSMLVLP
jgi:hypothetical protein